MSFWNIRACLKLEYPGEADMKAPPTACGEVLADGDASVSVAIEPNVKVLDGGLTVTAVVLGPVSEGASNSELTLETNDDCRTGAIDRVVSARAVPLRSVDDLGSIVVAKLAALCVVGFGPVLKEPGVLPAISIDEVDKGSRDIPFPTDLDVEPLLLFAVRVELDFTV